MILPLFQLDSIPTSSSEWTSDLGVSTTKQTNKQTIGLVLLDFIGVRSFVSWPVCAAYLLVRSVFHGYQSFVAGSFSVGLLDANWGIHDLELGAARWRLALP